MLIRSLCLFPTKRKRALPCCFLFPQPNQLPAGIDFTSWYLRCLTVFVFIFFSANPSPKCAYRASQESSDDKNAQAVYCGGFRNIQPVWISRSFTLLHSDEYFRAQPVTKRKSTHFLDITLKSIFKLTAGPSPSPGITRILHPAKLYASYR